MRNKAHDGPHKLCNACSMKVTDSVAGHARKKVRELQHVNPALRGARSPAWLRILDLFPGERTLFALCGIYGVFFTLLVIAGALLRLEPPLALAEELKALAEPDTGRNLLSYMLGAQATMVGLIFPLALGLVTLIVQRDEGASTNVDVQLYYHESRAYAVGTSGLTLALLILAELGRPEAFLLRILDSSQTTGSISLSLVLLLGVWLMANLLLTWQFLTTSLSFIRPAFRMASRQRYVAAAVIPPHLRALIADHHYVNIDRIYFQGAKGDSWPFVLPSASDLMSGERELVLHSAAPRVVRDIWLAPLRLAVASWKWRCARAGIDPAENKHQWMIGLPHGIGHMLCGEAILCRRRGGVPLNIVERTLIRFSIRLGRPRPIVEKPVTPGVVLEELADRVIVQMDRLAVTGFREALSEMIDFHRFLLAAHSIRKPDGTVESLSAYGYWASEHETWLREYGRLFERAAAHLEEEDSFLASLAHVAQRLLPKEGDILPPWVIAASFELPQYMVHRLGAWSLRKRGGGTTATGERALLDVPAARAYKDVLFRIAGAHEASLQSAWRHGGNTDDLEDDAAWALIAQRWPLLASHLKSSAYLVVAAHHHGDDIAIERYIDLLLHWNAALHATDTEADGHAQIHTDLILSDLFNNDWMQTQALTTPMKRFANLPFPSPLQVASVTLANLYADVRLLTALLLMRWASGAAPVSHCANSARRLVNGPDQSQDGPAPRLTPLEMVKIYVRLRLPELTNRESGYRDHLDTMVRQMDAMREDPQVTGRIHAVGSIFSFSALTGEWLSLVAAHADGADLDRIIQWLTRLGEDMWADHMGDATQDHLISWLDRIADLFDDERGKAEIRTQITAWADNIDPDPAAEALQGALRAAALNLRHHRDRRIVEAAIDPAVIADLEAKVSQALSGISRSIPFFVTVVPAWEAGEPPMLYQGRHFEKRSLIAAFQHDQARGEEIRLCREVVSAARAEIMQGFAALAREPDEAGDAEELFARLRSASEPMIAAGDLPIVRLPQTGPEWLENLDLLSLRTMLGNALVVDAAKRSPRYRFSYAGMDFYAANGGPVEIFPASLLQAISISVQEPRFPVRLEILEESDLLLRSIGLRFAVTPQWREATIHAIAPRASATKGAVPEELLTDGPNAEAPKPRRARRKKAART